MLIKSWVIIYMNYNGVGFTFIVMTIDILFTSRIIALFITKSDVASCHQFVNNYGYNNDSDDHSDDK